MNDMSPQFEESVYRVWMNESARVGTVVTNVVATDQDEGLSNCLFIFTSQHYSYFVCLAR